MLLLLPLTGFLLLGLIFSNRAKSSEGHVRGLETTLLLAATYGSSLTIGLLEGLSVGQDLRPSTVALGWLILDTVLLAALLVGRPRAGRWPKAGRWPVHPAEAVFLGLLGVYLGLLLLVALRSPPNNVDSLLYHMPRVKHWIQNEAVGMYATGYLHQLWAPPGAELGILELQLLWGNDALANGIQWLALVAALAAIVGIGRTFGLGLPAILGSLAFAVSVPMAVLQATSTQNDLVTGLLLLVFAYFVLAAQRRDLTPAEWVAAGLALGMGLLTKGTYYVFAAPIVAWLIASRRWSAHWQRGLVQVVGVLALAAAVNLPYWARNLRQGGTPLGPSEWMAPHATAVAPDRLVVKAPVRALRMLLVNFATPFPAVNQKLTDVVHGLSASLDLAERDPVLVFAWNHEDFAGSPFHLVLIAGVGVALVLRRGWPPGVRVYAASIAAGFLLLPWIVADADAPEAIRYQVPILLAFAPVIGAVLQYCVLSRTALVCAYLMLMSGMPWVLFNSTRPLVGMRPGPGLLELPCTPSLGCTKIGSILTQPSLDVLFANIREAEGPYLSAAANLADSSCRDIGLRIDSSDPEYPFWFLLGAPQSGYRLETIYTFPDLEALLDRDFAPCAIICTICGGRTRLHGLDLAAQTGRMKLFVGEGFTWDEDG